MIFDPADLSPRERYHLTIQSVVPRPIAWVSTTDSEGNFNLAPYSFFTGVGHNPLVLMFVPILPRVKNPKDTLANVKATGDFVINIVNEALAEAMSKSAAALPPDESEFEYAGLTPIASETVQSPRVAEAPVVFECQLRQIVEMGDQPGAGSAVFGTVTRIHVRDNLLVDGVIQIEQLQPIGRLGGSQYTKVTDIFSMDRG